mgnify:CR=1 FL=1
MKKILLIITVVLLLSLNLANAITQDDINEAKILIDSKADCTTLSDTQLEIIGEYYMEQMMPGISHERAHEIMGLKEGSEAEEQFHINLAKRSYCGENIGIIDGKGMMRNNYQTQQYNNTPSSNLGEFEIFFYITLTLIIIVLILIIALLINRSREKVKQRGGNNKK